MRILASTPTFFPIVGGAELLVDDVLTALSGRHTARLVTPWLPESSRAFWVPDGEQPPRGPYEVVRFEDRWDLLDVRGHKVTRGLIPPMSLSAVRVLDRQVRDFRPDVLLTFFGVPLGLPSALVKAWRDVPLVVVLCGSDVPSPRTADVPLWRRYLRLVTGAADRAVYVSRSVFDAVHERPFDPEHDLVIHGGVDLKRLPVTDPRGLRQRLGVGDGEAMLLTLSRLGPEKRVDVVVEAFALLRASGRRAVLVVGGRGPEREALEALAARLGVAGEVRFVGHLGEERGDYLAACDVFVFHSLFETFGQVMAEAAAFGKPVVSVRAGAIPEVVDDRVTGVLAEPLDPQGMAEALRALVDDPSRRAAMGERALEKAERCFAWPAQARMWERAVRFAGTDASGFVREAGDDVPA